MCIWTDLAANVVVVYSLHTISKARIEDAILKHKEPDTEPSKDKDIDTQFLFDNI